MRQYEVIKINNETWSIEDDFVRFFLLKGDAKALLIDTGFDISCVKALAQAILAGAPNGAAWSDVADGEKVLFDEASLSGQKEDAFPLELLNTHSDGDHCCGNHEFERFYMHEADQPMYRKQFGSKGDIVSINDGDEIDLGNRTLKIIHIPGHTFGSVALLDEKYRALFAGDSVQNGAIFMFGAHRSLEDYPASLIKLQEMEDQFDVIYASHAKLSLDPDYVGKCFDCCEEMLHGEVTPEEQEVHGNLVNAYNCGDCTFLIDPDRVFEESDPE